MTAFGALVIILVLILPLGFGASFALYRPAELGLPSRLALALSCGFAIPAFCSYAFVLFEEFYGVPVLAVLGAATIACWIVAWKRAQLLVYVHGVKVGDLIKDPSTVVGLSVIVVIAVLAVPGISAFSARIPFRYWVDGMQIARLHEIPTASIQYGDLYPTVSSKVLLDAFSAVVTSAVPQAQLAVGALSWTATVGTAIALWAVARESGLGTTAPLLPVLAVANPVFLGDDLTVDLFEYRAEALGRLVAFAALAFGVRAVRTRTLKDASVAGLLLAAAAGTHLVPALFVCVLIAGFALGRAIAERSRALLLGLFRTGAIILGGAAVGYGLVLAAPDSTGLGGPSASSEYGGYAHGLDPTAFLANVSAHPATDSWYRPPWRIVGSFFAQSLHSGRLSSARPLTLIAIGVAALAVAVYVLLRSQAASRFAPLACWTAAAVSISVALYFGRRYEVYTLATVGVRRLFDYGDSPRRAGWCGDLRDRAGSSPALQTLASSGSGARRHDRRRGGRLGRLRPSATAGQCPGVSAALLDPVEHSLRRAATCECTDRRCLSGDDRPDQRHRRHGAVLAADHVAPDRAPADGDEALLRRSGSAAGVSPRPRRRLRHRPARSGARARGAGRSGKRGSVSLVASVRVRLRDRGFRRLQEPRAAVGAEAPASSLSVRDNAARLRPESGLLLLSGAVR